jgi:protease-4
MALIKRPVNPLSLVLLLSAAFFVIFLLVSGVMFMTRTPGGSTSKMGSGIFGSGAVAIVELNGVIMDSKKLVKRIDRIQDDDEVKAIVVRINSPGGAVAPSQEIYDALKRSKKPVVASMASVAASGGYYVACAAKKIYANPGTITGSIGVIMEFINIEKLYEWAKVQRYAVKTGKFKDIGAEYKQMSPDERALLQGMVDDVLLQFKTAIVEGRKLPMEQVTAIADGRIFSGSQAKAAKLVDELGPLQDAINEAGKMAGIKGKPRVVEAEKKKRNFLRMLLDEGDDEFRDSSESSRLGGGWLGKLAQAFAGRQALTQLIEQNTPSFTPGLYWLWGGAR